MLSKEFIEKMRQRLLKEKKTVDEKIAKYSAPEESMENPDWDDLGNDAVEDLVEENIVESLKKIQEKLERALKKIEDGTYGKCEFCNAEYSEEQLEMVPWADPCHKCAKK